MKIENSKHAIDDFYELLDKFKIKYESKSYNIFEEMCTKQGNYYAVSKNNNIFRNILTNLEVSENEIKEFLENKYLNDTLISYKLVVLYALYKHEVKNSVSSFKLNKIITKILDLQVSSLANRITSKYLGISNSSNNKNDSSKINRNFFSNIENKNIFKNLYHESLDKLKKEGIPQNEVKKFLESNAVRFLYENEIQSYISKSKNETEVSFEKLYIYLKNSSKKEKEIDIKNFISSIKKEISLDSYQINIIFSIFQINNNFNNKESEINENQNQSLIFDFRKVSLPNLNDIKDIEEEIKIFFIEKLGFLKGKSKLTIYEAYQVFKSSFFKNSPIKDHLEKNKMLLSYYTNTKHVTKLASLLIEKNSISAEKRKEVEILIKKCFRNNFTDNKDDLQDIKEELSEHKIFDLLYSKLKEEHNIELNIKDFYEAQKHNPNLSSTSLDNLIENDKAITTSLLESKSELDSEQALVLDVLFKFFAKDTNKNKVYRRKLYLLFLEYVLEMESKDIANSLNTSTSTITQSKEDLLSDLFYLTDSKIDKYLDEWFKKDILKVDKEELKEKIIFFDKQPSNYINNLKNYFSENTKTNNLSNNILYFINGLTVLKTKESLGPLIREFPNIKKEILQKVDIGKGNIDNQIEMYFKNLNQNFDKEIIAKTKLLFKQFDKEIILKEINNLKDDDLYGFFKRSKEIIQSNFYFIPELYFSKLENSSNITETFNKDNFFLLASLFSNNKIRNEGKDFEQIKLSFNSFDNFKDFLLENPIEVPRKFSSSLIVEEAKKIIFSELKEIYHG